MNKTEDKGQIWNSRWMAVTAGILLCFILMAGAALRARASQIIDTSSLAEMASSLLDAVSDENAGGRTKTL